MRNDPKAMYGQALRQELDLREGKALHLADAAGRLQRQGQAAMALAIRDMWRHNEVERIKLQAQLDAVNQ